jgi:hypothetical protein
MCWLAKNAQNIRSREKTSRRPLHHAGKWQLRLSLDPQTGELSKDKMRSIVPLEDCGVRRMPRAKTKAIPLNKLISPSLMHEKRGNSGIWSMGYGESTNCILWT